ncbi:hypothetical protein D6Q77_23865, partial [Salmonella enterica subsp. enterica serovar Muenchen]|nr:hypothetical protein [Salmonella enterica]EAS1782353.1 hypothetical protein [Salmonella enterica]EBY8399714.1 hypothetical protein [Salmonella enterica subsp. enterica serovar Muenchen]ECJ9112272.1 hypothetical protein [Salmonella enterica]
MKNTHDNISAALESFGRKHDRVKILSESKELLDYFHANTRSRPIFFWLLILSLAEFCIMTVLFNIMKKNIAAGLYDVELFMKFAVMSVIILMMPAIYLLVKQKSLSRMDDIIIEQCIKKNDWSVPALKASSTIISSVQGSLEKRLNTFKIICGGFAFIIVLFTNKITTAIPYDIINQILSDTYLTGISFLIICIT